MGGASTALRDAHSGKMPESEAMLRGYHTA